MGERYFKLTLFLKGRRRWGDNGQVHLEVAVGTSSSKRGGLGGHTLVAKQVADLINMLKMSV